LKNAMAVQKAAPAAFFMKLSHGKQAIWAKIF